MVDYRTAKGWLTPHERALLHGQAHGVAANGLMVNIGIEYGASLVCLRQGNKNATILAIDVIGDSKIDTTIPAPILYVRGDSTVAGPIMRPVCAGLVFVDGGHDYHTVQRDAIYWGSVVAPGGVMLFHDTDNSPAQDEVNLAVSDWLREYGPGYWIELKKVDSIRWFRRVAVPPAYQGLVML